RSRAARHQDDADLAGRARVSFGSVDRAAFLAYQDVAQRILLEQRIVDRQDRTAGIAEYDIDALIQECLDDDIRTTDRLGRHDLLPQKLRLGFARGRPSAVRGSGTLVSYARTVNRKWSIK